MRAAAVVAATVLSLSSTAQAQTTPSPVPRNAVSLNALGVVVDYIRGTGLPFELEYERALTDRVSIYVAPRLTWISNELTSGFGGGASVGARWFVYRGPAVAGVWLGADVGSDYRVETANGTDATISGFDGVLVRAMAGYNLLIGSLYVSPGIGIAYRWPELPTYHLRVGLGYAF